MFKWCQTVECTGKCEHAKFEKKGLFLVLVFV